MTSLKGFLSLAHMLRDNKKRVRGQPPELTSTKQKWSRQKWSSEASRELSLQRSRQRHELSSPRVPFLGFYSWTGSCSRLRGTTQASEHPSNKVNLLRRRFLKHCQWIQFMQVIRRESDFPDLQRASRTSPEFPWPPQELLSLWILQAIANSFSEPKRMSYKMPNAYFMCWDQEWICNNTLVISLGLFSFEGTTWIAYFYPQRTCLEPRIKWTFPRLFSTMVT